MSKNSMTCRPGCAACCIAPSITTPMPNMPDGKPAGVRCKNLTEENLCMIFGREDRPLFCRTLKPSMEMCGDSFEQASAYLEKLELMTK